MKDSPSGPALAVAILAFLLTASIVLNIIFSDFSLFPYITIGLAAACAAFAAHYVKNRIKN
ncbi:hypothetical protein G3I59_13975 [Amycolatopsis rubida]|uniref:Uncharacterized protein n=1 Tax=Amycolatopsis rubida TaxID=112413 RepID=A0ABX0BNU8_9PSEU|nr:MULTISPECIES: hypothetical protein [Amycolatopsis]MYW91680.1 hypothetical protein [Amycolatopsis rubida]NEC56664.1 hypothetical protein [Amycolatopsis rubida]OAP20447.1 hypothetical protein A4R44_08871 [Amycolatopsis sp. M39]